jgi:hypothetical protein
LYFSQNNDVNNTPSISNHPYCTHHFIQLVSPTTQLNLNMHIDSLLEAVTKEIQLLEKAVSDWTSGTIITPPGLLFLLFF